MGRPGEAARPENEFELMLKQGSHDSHPLHQFEEATPPRDHKFDSGSKPEPNHITLASVLDKLAYLNKVQ